ncbi:hypothetical protein [Clostridium kluyveri]|uniref:hypothetical protein n=1 Tax=Clostridium kluyveri TaxID=1534 RepID=UPI002245D502|nr:hypothetical protein [Clostridium kluyveri]UZQ52427.1 hypothetical protein OP486_09795 [Clostridium kluyveri]
MDLEKIIRDLSDKGSKIYSIEYIKINYEKDGSYDITLCPKDCAEDYKFSKIEMPDF